MPGTSADHFSFKTKVVFNFPFFQHGELQNPSGEVFQKGCSRKDILLVVQTALYPDAFGLLEFR